jgi:hypothetical protein
MPQLKKNQLILERITDSGLKNPKFHRYNVCTQRGIYCITHEEAMQLFEQMIPYFQKENENVSKKTGT